MCIAGIFSLVPFARTIQEFVNRTAGKEFFSYLVFSSVGIGLALLLYSFIFRLKVKNASQYIWLFLCAGLYVYFTVQLRKNPVEAVHFLVYGLLSCFLFRALNHRIRDRTVYITVLLFVLFAGTVDEFLQWITPLRYWDFRDVGFNTLAGGIFLLAVWKGVRPESVYESPKKISVKMLAVIMTANIIFLGLCLSNTPDSVRRYSETFKTLSWLKNEEPMTEFGYRHKDPEIGVFYSRLMPGELEKIDLANGKRYGTALAVVKRSDTAYKELTGMYTPYNNPFLYEFLIHIFRRDSNLNVFEKTDDPDKKIRSAGIAFRENLLVEKYFGAALKHSGLVLDNEKVKRLKETASLRKVQHTSRVGRNIITAFSQKQALSIIAGILVIVLISCAFWIRRLEE